MQLVSWFSPDGIDGSPFVQSGFLGVSPSNRRDSHDSVCCALGSGWGIGRGDGRVKPRRVPEREVPVRPPVSTRRADTT